MRPLTLRIVVALLAFAFGVSAVTLWKSFTSPHSADSFQQTGRGASRRVVSTEERTDVAAPFEQQDGCACAAPWTDERESLAKASPVPTISGGILNGKAVSKPAPGYPPFGQVRVEGTVVVSILVDERGCVESAEATKGHPLLRASAVEAAYHACFTPTRLSGQPVKVSGFITYNFRQ